jgi:hypothetical protein
MNESGIKTFGHMSYVMDYNARTDMACFIGWITTRSLLTQFLRSLLHEPEAHL